MYPLADNTIFAGRYKILARIGQGGMGQVYRAEHIGLGKEVALKVLGSQSADWKARFDREARVVARLDHPGCVRIRDHGKDERGVPFLVMDLVDGPTLTAALGGDTFSVKRSVAVAKGLLAALAHAHAHGVVHRDVKPENIMFSVRAGMGVVLIDFGLASIRDAAPLTGAGLAIGSPSYIAPERLRGLPNDARVDLYSVGVILYEMIAGIRPFLGSSPQEIMAAALSRPPRPLRAVVPEVPEALDAFIRRALAKDPDRRFCDAEAMLSALTAIEAALEAPVVDPAIFVDAELDEARASRTFVHLDLRPAPWWRRFWRWLHAEPSRA